jgi:Arc/MetJ-type ribon-helix-helix transcriptional regulator
VKLSVSIPDDDVAFLDEFARRSGLDSRSAVVQRAIAMLQAAELADDYAQAFAEWADANVGAAWDSAAGDGLTR